MVAYVKNKGNRGSKEDLTSKRRRILVRVRLYRHVSINNWNRNISFLQSENILCTNIEITNGSGIMYPLAYKGRE
jgi:hypothetical protein